jgi:rare lipoprotein A
MIRCQRESPVIGNTRLPICAKVSYTTIMAVLLVAACARPRASTMVPADVTGYEETGQASWYGPPYHGRRAASGEVYDMNQLTAAHRTLPFGTWLAVQNVNNGRVAEVRVNDRGPFGEGRILDLSYAAARALDATARGVIPVRLRVIVRSAASPPIAARVFTVQVGAFEERDRAAELQRELAGRGADARIEQAAVGSRAIFRVRVGRFASHADAAAEARRVAASGVPVFIVAE